MLWLGRFGFWLPLLTLLILPAVLSLSLLVGLRGLVGLCDRRRHRQRSRRRSNLGSGDRRVLVLRFRRLRRVRGTAGWLDRARVRGDHGHRGDRRDRGGGPG